MIYIAIYNDSNPKLHKLISNYNRINTDSVDQVF